MWSDAAHHQSYEVTTERDGLLLLVAHPEKVNQGLISAASMERHHWSNREGPLWKPD